MKNQVYLAGNIGTLTYEECTNWRKYVTDKCTLYYNDSIIIKDPMRFKEYLNTNNKLDFVYEDNVLCTPKAIVGRDINDVITSDLIIANLDTDIISIGTSCEVNTAYLFRIPVLGIFSKDPNNIYNKHPFIQEMVSYKVFDLDEAIELVGKVL